MSSVPIYKLDDKIVYCFSDWEGMIPYKLLKSQFLQQEGVLETPYNRILSMFDVEHNLNASLTGTISEDEALIYTGDLLDRGPYSIRLMQRMLKLKNSAAQRVVLIGGNRDFNKLRLAHEFFITDQNNNLPWSNREDIKNKEQLLAFIMNIVELWDTKYKFKYNSNDLNVVLTSPPWNGSLKFPTDLSRVHYIFEKSMGIFHTSAYATELMQIFKITEDDFPSEFTTANNVKYQNFKHALVAIVFMVMTRKWSNLPSIFEPYNALILDYLSQCHFIAAFRHGDNKFGFASHSGLPLTTNGENKLVFTLSDPLGVVVETNTPRNLKDVLKNIESWKQNVISLFSPSEYLIKNSDDDEIATVRNSDSFRQMIFITANTGKNKIGNETYSSELSPVATMASLNAKGPKALAKNKKAFKIAANTFTGGSYADVDANAKNTLQCENGNEVYLYNIFGHQPAGYAPQASRVDVCSDGKKNVCYHICMDISKAEFVPKMQDYSPEHNVAFFVLTEDSKGIFYGVANNIALKQDTEHVEHRYRVEIDNYVNQNLEQTNLGNGVSTWTQGFDRFLVRLPPQPHVGGQSKKHIRYEKLTVKELTAKAKARGIKTSKLTKEQLITALRKKST